MDEQAFAGSEKAVRARNRIRTKRYETQAEGYLELGMPQHALNVLARLEGPEAFGAHALYLRGEALRTMERYWEALVPLGQSVLVTPDNVHAWLAIGWCQKRTDRIDLAIDAIEHALNIDPSEALIHYNLACYLSLVGDKTRALRHLSEALTIDSDYRMLIDDEPDFDPLRSDPDFLALTSIIV